MAQYKDLMELKNDTARKKTIRERIAIMQYNAAVAEFGAENVRLLKNKITVFETDIPANTVIIDVGDVKDNDGAIVGALVFLDSTVKSWNTVVTRRNNTIYAVTMADIDIAIGELED